MSVARKLSLSDIFFVRCQPIDAVPLLARLYDVPEEEMRAIRGLMNRRSSAEAMPLRLLEQLVEQRAAPMQAEHFVERPSMDPAGEDVW